jgi:hypothetical protein
MFIVLTHGAETTMVWIAWGWQVSKLSLTTVIDGHLGFDIDTQFMGMGEGVVIHFLHQHPCVGDGAGHIVGGFTIGISEHDPLIPRTDLTVFLVNPLVNIGRLTVEEDLYLYIIGMETLFTGKVRVSVIADLFEGVEGDVFVLFGTKLNIRGNFPSDDDVFSGNKYFAGNTAFAITDDETIDDTVGNNIGAFVGMAGGDDFGGKEVHNVLVP